MAGARAVSNIPTQPLGFELDGLDTRWNSAGGHHYRRPEQQWISIHVPCDTWLQVVPFLLSTKELFITVCLPRSVPVFMALIPSCCFWPLSALQKQVVTLVPTQRQEKWICRGVVKFCWVKVMLINYIAFFSVNLAFHDLSQYHSKLLWSRTTQGKVRK